MIIFISDLHFVDETAGKNNINARAFEGAFNDIKKYMDKIDEIKLVFLGDIFDLNRTTYWLDHNISERPWGDLKNKGSEIENHSNEIFENIIDKNKKTFDIFKGSMKDRFDFLDEPERIYIPGNHDRLCNVYETLREKVRINLGMPVCKDPFPHLYDNKNYGVIARHGHEFDIWNYEGTTNYMDSDYAKIPMGDLITTEIASRLPYTIMKHVDKMNPPMHPAERESLKRNLEEIDNVRPYIALFAWLFYQVRENSAIKNEVNEAVREIAINLDDLPYFQDWCKKHDKFLKIDEANELQGIVDLFKSKRVDVDFVEGLAEIYSKIVGSPDNLPMDNSDSVLINKAKDFLMNTSEYRYYVMGHTHTPMQVPIRITSRNNKQFEQFYLNTGTWRKSYQKAERDFIGLKNLSYTIIYSEKENPGQRFETWTGTLKEE